MPLSIINFKRISDNLELNFDLTGHEKWQVVCPNPTIADAFRNALKEHPRRSDIETTTIAKFLGDNFSRFYPEKKVARKADLMQTFATVWKLKFPGRETSYFSQSFELFTDLRSFTLDTGVAESALEHYPTEISESVRLFWLILENQEIIDEHLAYSELITAFQEVTDSDVYENLPGFIFSGFSHLSANQIDLLKTLGRIVDVFVPIPLEVLKEALPTDWVDWIQTQADIVINHEANEEPETPLLKVVPFPSGRSNSFLGELWQETPGDVLFPVKGITFKEALKLPSKNIYFRSQNQGLRDGLNTLKKEALEYFKNFSTPVLAKELSDYLLNSQKEEKLSSYKSFLVLRLKVLLAKTVSDYESLSEANETLSKFDLDLIWQVAELNGPRSYNQPLIKKTDFNLLSLKELYQFNTNKKTYLVCESNHDLSVGGTTNYPKEVQEILIASGPLRRKGLDLSFYLYQIKEILKIGNVTVLLEEGVLEHDQALNKLFKNFNVENENVEPKKKEKKPFKPEISSIAPVKTLSASRMQTYLDCPRKYYYSHLMRLGAEPDRERTIDPRIMGELEHKVVELYLNSFDDWDEAKYLSLLEETIAEKIPNELMNKLAIREEVELEGYFYPKEIIIQFLKLKKADPEIKFQFEKEIPEPAVGQADALIESKVFGRMLFDLKRSGSSIPDKYEIQKLNAVQIWYYMYFLQGTMDQYDTFGYINLSDPEASIVYCLNPDTQNKLEMAQFFEGMDYLKLPKNAVYSELLEDFKLIYDETFNSLQQSNPFEINPRNAQVCTYCPGTDFCDRGLSI